MRHSARKTHTLYSEIPTHSRAMAACYHCGRRARAEQLLWVQQPMPVAYRALCVTCASRACARGAGPQGTSASKSTDEDAMAVLARADGPGWTATEIAATLGQVARADDVQATLERLVARARLVRCGVGRGAIYRPVSG